MSEDAKIVLGIIALVWIAGTYIDTRAEQVAAASGSYSHPAYTKEENYSTDHSFPDGYNENYSHYNHTSYYKNEYVDNYNHSKHHYNNYYSDTYYENTDWEYIEARERYLDKHFYPYERTNDNFLSNYRWNPYRDAYLDNNYNPYYNQNYRDNYYYNSYGYYSW